MSGTLFVVATPIGNLEDLTFRALRTLKEVDLIAAEDTRRTAKLLARYEVSKPLVSLREHNEVRETPRLVARLSSGESIALVTDAGTPGIADPGARLVAAAHEASVRVVPIPGPSAVTAALSVCGFSGEEFVFMGFPPASGTARMDWFERVSTEPRVVVLFEAPHRIKKTVGDIAKHCSHRRIAVLREASKIHETLVISDINSISVESLADIGEFVLVLSEITPTDSPVVDGEAAEAMLGRLTDIASIETEMALGMVSHALSSSPAAVKKAIKKHRILVNKQADRTP